MQIDDVEAIDVYMNAQHANNKQSQGILDLYKSWYQNGGWYDKSFSSDWYDEQRSRKHQFDLANAATPADKAQVQKVLAEGITSEEQQGLPRPRIDPKTGAVGSQIHSPTVPGIAPGLSRNLKKGLTGDDVKQWQSFLGLTPPTGYFDALTDTKTREWQKSRHLKVDGIVGKNSWSDAFGVHAVVTTTLPTPDIQTPAAAKNEPKPAGTPAATNPANPTTEAAVVSTIEASMIPTAIQKLPLWAKVLGGLGMAGGAIYGVKKYEDRT